MKNNSVLFISKLGPYALSSSDDEFRIKYYRTAKDYLDICASIILFVGLLIIATYLIFHTNNSDNQIVSSENKIITNVLIIATSIFLASRWGPYIIRRIISSSPDVLSFDKNLKVFTLRKKHSRNIVKVSNIRLIRCKLNNEFINWGGYLKQRSWVEIYFELIDGGIENIDIVNSSKIIDVGSHKTINEIMNISGGIVKFISKEAGVVRGAVLKEE